MVLSMTVHKFMLKEDNNKVNVINNAKETTIEVKIEEEKPQKEQKQEKKSLKTTQKQQKTAKSGKEMQKAANGTYKLTHYGHDCCKSGKTATGYDVRNTIYYNDNEYGNVRIVAMCKNIPLYSIVKIKNYKITGGDVIAIVIDRGVGCSTIDLLVENEAKSSKLGIQRNTIVEILRKGK